MNAPSQVQGQAFARDVRRIRETHGVTQQEIHQATKIPKHLLQQFEVDALFSHDTFNRVYLRSVARSVADHIGVDRKDMMDALEAALSGDYEGQLAAAYYGTDPETSSSTEPVPQEATTEDAVDTEAERPKAAQASASPSTVDHMEDTPAAEAQREAAPVPPQEKTDIAGKDAVSKDAVSKDAVSKNAVENDVEQNEPLGAATDEDLSPDSPPIEETAATTSAGAPGSALPASKGAVGATEKKQPAPVQPRPVWPYVAGGAVAVAAVILLIIALQSDQAPEPTPPAPMAVAPVDTAAEATAPALPDAAGTATDEATGPPALGDTITVEVVAAFDRVDPIRIRVDDDLRRPYWIEQGESRSFSAVDQIILENQLDAIELRLEGVPVPTDERDAEGRIVITRERAERLLSENAPSS